MISRIVSFLIIASAVVAAYKLSGGDVGVAASFIIDTMVSIVDTGSDVLLGAYQRITAAL